MRSSMKVSNDVGIVGARKNGSDFAGAPAPQQIQPQTPPGSNLLGPKQLKGPFTFRGALCKVIAADSGAIER